ncbi:L-arabinose ABC transporter [Campylobacter pinnipediorum]|uniref:L-arabinose ABC transporter n=1 Tax=Campylobacter pinnipediorum subsp. pinnipediorum TaxID=1660067 RepID=A0AAX0L9H7_9BACT|nr:L-arabinose ABC transporter [Campylobacter pinnipediorum]AQW82954.1 putative membrane protein [Campylobacter pinnipediorum subsp. pinnipediorum]OPA77294.1 L-arabinose ABC transporter [Campylobacter pinnipediorum subsp. pinnipediorum]OPA78221.1 L-arabinose ABC transporter [Campylobacter pinnipediorum subsp. pinnipediorum]
MCCFGVRVFLLFFITIMSFVSHKFYNQIPVVGYYFIFANIVSMVIFSLFFSNKLPAFVKKGAVHYFSLIGGVIGSFLSMICFKQISKNSFFFIECFLLVFWIVLTALTIKNLNNINLFLNGFLQ